MTSPHLTQTFGIEIECYLPEGGSMQAAARAVAQRIGRPVNVEGYNHSARPDWKVVTDGSLGSTRGCEFVSPILNGEAGLREIGRVCEALADFGCTVNRSCGYHVHVGVGSPDLNFWKRLVKLYAIFEPIIDAMMPVSRRAGNNTYCRSITSTNLATLDAARDFDAVMIAATGSRHAENRYYKLNLAAYRRHRTVEFRQHSGTLDGTKAMRWTSLCLRMVHRAKRDLSLNVGTSASGPANRARPNSKAYQVGQMLLRPEGVTAREVMAALGWPSVSLPQQAGICGIQFTTQRTGREVRYFAVQTQAAQERVEISIEGFASLIEADETEREYIRQRTRDLSGSIAWAA